MSHRRAGGFTLVEVLIALSIGAALLAVVFGSVRAGLAAWGRGEARAMALEHDRSLNQMLRRAVAGTFPYRGGSISAGMSGTLFMGEPDSMTIVTVSPPIPAPFPIAFTAVRVSRDERGLTVRQLALPSAERVERVEAVLTDPAVLSVRFRYLGEEADAWTDRWDLGKAASLPRAVEIRLTTASGARAVEQPPIVVPIRVLTP